MHAIQTHQHPLIIQIMIGNEVGFRISLHQRSALLKIHSHHQRVEALMQSRKQNSAHLEPRRAIGRDFFRVIHRHRHPPRIFEGYRHNSPAQRAFAAKYTAVVLSVPVYVDLNIGLTLTLQQATAYFIEWTVTGLVIGLIYRPLTPHRQRRDAGLVNSFSH